MTVSSQTSTATFVGNGVATAFPLPFRFFENGDIRAYFIDSVTGAATQMVIGSDYTLIGAGEPEVDGNALSLLTTTVPLASMRGLYVERFMPQTQSTDLVNQGEFFASTHEDVFDRLTMLIQQQVTETKKAKAEADEALAIAQEMVARQEAFENNYTYVILGPYAAGLVFTSRNQVFSYMGEFYAPGPAITLPYTATGAGASEIANFVSVGDAVLRQDLANPEKGPWAIGGVVAKLPVLADLQAFADSHVGLVVDVTGRGTPQDGGGALWEVVEGVAPNGFTSVGLANGLVAEIVPTRGEVSAEACGCIGSGDVTGAAQAWVNYSASKGVKAVTTTASRMTVSGLSLPGGCDVDFGNREPFLADDSNVPLLRNANRSFIAKLDKNISVRGRVPLNCNEAGQAALDVDGAILPGVRMVGVENIHFNIHVKSAARYQMWLINVDGFFSDHLVITATHASGYTNTDGLHIGGKCSNINVGRLEVYGCEDDALALVAVSGE